MKVIFSRKGFDSSYGGFPSVILPSEMGNKMISFPIPETNSNRAGKKADELCFVLHDGNSLSLKDIFEQLGITDKINVPSEPKSKGLENTVFHFDPEVQEIEDGRTYVAFGQRGAASSHLLSNGINAGDVFLFFGTFKKTLLENGKITYDSAIHEIQAIWGYMIVDDIIHVNNIEESQFAKYPDIGTHLHYVNRKSEVGENIIICGKHFGTFDYDDKYRLTKLGYKKSFWELPDIFRYTDIAYCGRVENPARFKSADIGQEFVVSNLNESKMIDWLKSLGIIL